SPLLCPLSYGRPPPEGYRLAGDAPARTPVTCGNARGRRGRDGPAAGPALAARQPGQQTAPRPTAPEGLDTVDRPTEPRQADDAVAGGRAVAEGRHRRRDADALHRDPRHRPTRRRAAEALQEARAAVGWE